MMGSIEQSNKESVLSPALANVALLIAAPSLGCLKTYIKVFSELCGVYSLHIPDMEQVLQYSTSASVSSLIGSSKTDCAQKTAHVMNSLQEPNIEHLEIKKEPVDPDFDAVEAKLELICNGNSYEPWCNTVKEKQELTKNKNPEVLLYDTDHTVMEKQDFTKSKNLEGPELDGVEAKLELIYNGNPEELKYETVKEKQVITKNKNPEVLFSDTVRVKQDFTKNKNLDDHGFDTNMDRQEIGRNKNPEDLWCHTDKIKQELSININPKVPLCDTDEVKQEVTNSTALYNARLYDTQDSSREMGVKDESTKLELPIDIALEIPLIIKDKSKRTCTETSTQGTALKKYKGDLSPKLETPFDCALGKMDKSLTGTNIQVSILEKPLKSKNAKLEKPFDQSLSKMEKPTKSTDLSPSVNSDPFSIMLSNIENKLSRSGTRTSKSTPTHSPSSFFKVNSIKSKSKPNSKFKSKAKCKSKSKFNSKSSPMQKDNTNSLANSKSSLSNFSMPKHSRYSILDKNGGIRYASSFNESRQILTEHGLKLQFTKNEQTQLKDCRVYVHKAEDCTIRECVLGIWIKGDRTLQIPFAKISEISKSTLILSGFNAFNGIKICYKSTNTKSIEYLFLCATSEYLQGITDWLSKFLS